MLWRDCIALIQMRAEILLSLAAQGFHLVREEDEAPPRAAHLRQADDAGLPDSLAAARDEIAGERVEHALERFIDQPLRSCIGIIERHRRVVALEERDMGAHVREIEDA